MAAWRDSNVRTGGLAAAIWLAAITVLAGIIVWKLVA